MTISSCNRVFLACERAFCYLFMTVFLFVASSAGYAMPDKNEGHELLIAIQQQSEWEPGVQRQLRQIVLAADGRGQVVKFQDDRPVKIAGFQYSPNDFLIWNEGHYRSFADSYVTEPMDDGLLVEGDPALFGFFFITANEVKIIDVEQNSNLAPSELTALAKHLQALAEKAESLTPEKYYLRAMPLGVGQSREVRDAGAVHCLGSQDLPLVLQQTLTLPLWLFPLDPSQFIRIAEFFHSDHSGEFVYIEHDSGHVFRIDLLH
ncbi:MAG: hypothetical protein GXP22_03845 [Gammaproteobacteria bacterium]|nr:hypothetical protein [Gammaproteobacteria bacterium]